MRTRSNGGIIGVFNNTSAYGANGFWYATDAATLAINYRWPIPPLGVLIYDAAGGIINEYVSSGVYYRTHTFSSGGTFTINQDAGGIADVLLIGGGGGGGASYFGSNAADTSYVNMAGGGGGAGGVFEITGIHLPQGSYTITVGAGGSGGTDGVPGSIGANTVMDGQGLTVTALGGGGGAGTRTIANNATSGASGGGSRGLTAYYSGANREPGALSANTQQGFAGGAGFFHNNGGTFSAVGGSGGGASSVGQGATSSLDTSYPPGNGLYSSISGVNTGYGGGGYGGISGSYAFLMGTHIAPADFGGGSLPSTNYTNTSSSVPTLMQGVDGKGGGGAGGTAGPGAVTAKPYFGGRGGNGLVIVRYRYQ